MTDVEPRTTRTGAVETVYAAPVIMKFGGTSVRDTGAIRRLSEIVGRENRRRLVVVSALAGVTDQLVDLASRATAGETPELGEIVDAIETRHRTIAADLVSAAALPEVIQAIEQSCFELRAMVHAVAVLLELSPRSADAITGCGELMSSRLVAASLVSDGVAAEWVDARRVLVTDGSHGRAQPDSGDHGRAAEGCGRPVTRQCRDPGARRLCGCYTRRGHHDTGPRWIRLLGRALWGRAGRDRDPDLDRRRRHAHGRPGNRPGREVGAEPDVWRGVRACLLRSTGAPPGCDTAGHHQEHPGPDRQRAATRGARHGNHGPAPTAMALRLPPSPPSVA